MVSVPPHAARDTISFDGFVIDVAVHNTRERFHETSFVRIGVGIDQRRILSLI
jgi:hypothetical protein